MEDPSIKVLIIDDEQDLLDIAKQFLEFDPTISVDTSLSAADALKMIERREYGVIVSDYQMPRKDGIQLLKEIRGTGNKIPFILFTGKGREEVAIEALNNGANFYLQKGGQSASQFAELANMIKQAYFSKLGEQALRISEERYRILFESSIDAVMLTTKDFESILSANPSACKLFGMTEDEIRAIGIKGLITDNKTWENVVRRLNETGIIKGEFIYRRKDGTTFTGETTHGILAGHYGIARISMIVREVSERKLADEAICENEKKYHNVFDWANDAILLHTLSTEEMPGRFFEVNEGACNMLGYNKQELLSMGPQDITPPEFHPQLKEIRRQAQTKDALLFEISLLRKDGTTVPIEASVHLVDYEGKKIWISHLRDITKRKENEEALQFTKEKYESLFNQMIDCIYTSDLEGNNMNVNDALLALLGYTKEELSLLNFFSMLDPEQVPKMLENVEEIIRTGSQKQLFEIRLRRMNGEYVSLEASASIVYQKGMPYAIQGVARDITNSKRAERAIHYANRKLNLLSSITRHDINNQLMVLDGNLTLLSMKELDPASKELLRKSYSAMNRISGMVQFTKEYEDVGIKAPIWQNVRSLTEKEAKSLTLGKIKLANDVPSDIEIYADPLVSKVFHNLTDNAVRHGGKITTIRFFTEEVDDARRIVCEDNGNGISADMEDVLFKHDSKDDHGFGLFLSREILAITGITIQENGEPGKGARFEMNIPAGAWRSR